MYFPVRKRGRFAKMMSFFVKHSWAKDGEETTTTRREPNQSEKMSPYVCDRVVKVRWRGCFRWWRLPIIGIVGGPGGRFFSLLDVILSKILMVMMKDRERRE